VSSIRGGVSIKVLITIQYYKQRENKTMRIPGNKFNYGGQCAQIEDL